MEDSHDHVPSSLVLANVSSCISCYIVVYHQQ